MNIEEIRKNAPEGATHYDKDCFLGSVTYWEVTNDKFKMWCFGRWGKGIDPKYSIISKYPYIGSFFDRIYLHEL